MICKKQSDLINKNQVTYILIRNTKKTNGDQNSSQILGDQDICIIRQLMSINIIQEKEIDNREKNSPELKLIAQKISITSNRKSKNQNNQNRINKGNKLSQIQ